MSAPDTSGRGARVVTVLAVLLVAAVAAVVSFAHMREVADRAGEQWRAWLLPLSVDGLVIAASMVLVTRRRGGLPGGRIAWCALLGGVGASLAANIAAAEPTVTARLVAAWPALAFAVAFELLLQQRRVDAPAPVAEAAVPDPVPAVAPVTAVPPPVAQVTGVPPSVAVPAPAAELPTPAGDHRPVGDPAGDPLPAVPAAVAWQPDPTPASEPEPVPEAELTDEQLLEQLHGLLEGAGDRAPGRRVLARELGVTEHRIRRLTNGSAPR